MKIFDHGNQIIYLQTSWTQKLGLKQFVNSAINNYRSKVSKDIDSVIQRDDHSNEDHEVVDFLVNNTYKFIIVFIQVKNLIYEL